MHSSMGATFATCALVKLAFLTKVAIRSCHVNQDQIAEGLLLRDRHRNYMLETLFLYKRGIIKDIGT
jgi:hypothetical protein